LTLLLFVPCAVVERLLPRKTSPSIPFSPICKPLRSLSEITLSAVILETVLPTSRTSAV
jgi:hypothetical protein